MIAYDYVFFDFINDSTSLVVGTPARPPIFVAQSAAAAEANVAAWRAGTGPRRIFCRRRKRRRDHVVQTAVRPMLNCMSKLKASTSFGRPMPLI